MERLLDYFVPERYNLNLQFDVGAKRIIGEAKIVGEAKSEVVRFHATELKIKEVTVNGRIVEFKYNNDLLEIPKVELGNNTIEIGYEGTLNENMEGAYLSTYQHKGKTETIIATQFESHYAREAFPCIDEPAAKAVFEVSITVPEKDDLVLSNMPAINVVKNTTVFEPTPRMSTYLLAWVIGKFHGKTVKNEHGVEITTYVPLNQDVDSVDFANEVAAKSLEFYDDNFGEPYPLAKLDQVALPDFEAGAMENWGLVTYRESMLIVGKNATLGTKKSVALTVAHELSHQWFGDLVTMKWWDDLWLNESFASVMEYYAVDYIYPEFRIFEGFFTGDAYAALMRDAYTDVQSVHQEVHSPEEIATLFDSAIVYSKGARLMLMLIRLMGWEQFCKGVRDYFEKYKYGNTVGDDLWVSLEPYAEFEPKKLMHAFIDQPGYPVITGNDGFDKFEQKRFLLDGKMTQSNWPLPKVMEDMSGHYVLNLTEEQFAERLENFDKLGLEEKLRLLIDRNLLAKTELVSAASLLPLLEKFQDEESAAVWGVILTIVSNLKVFFEPDSDEEKKYKQFVGKLVRAKLSKLGLKTKSSDDENTIKLRAILLGLDFYAETVDTIEELAGMYQEDYFKLDAELRESIIDAKLYVDPDIIDEYLEAYQKIADPEVKFELLFAGTIAKEPKVLDKMLKLLDRYDIVKPQDQLYLYVYLYRNHRSRESAFRWLREHWQAVREMAGDKTIESYPRYMAGAARTKTEYEAWRKFFEPMKNDPALARAIEIGRNEIEARLLLIKRDSDAVKRALK